MLPPKVHQSSLYISCRSPFTLQLHCTLPRVNTVPLSLALGIRPSPSLAPAMSLNSVVNNLVRAAAGISTEISDADLDQHVAKLLADEAKAREVKWSELGLGAFLGGDRGSGRDS